MEGVTMKRKGKLLVLEVAGLAENRPSILKGDALFAQIRTGKNKADLDSKTYKGYVHQIEMIHVHIGFGEGLLKRFVNGMLFDVQFTFNRLPLKLQHRAVDQCSNKKLGLSPVLFPQPFKLDYRSLLRPLLSSISLFDRQLECNTQQVSAVKHILSGSSRPSPYLIFGPPGTGKTVTMVEAIKQVYKSLPGSFILACAPSNSAADLIAQRLLKNTPVAKSTILRLNALSRNWATVNPAVKDICNFDRAQGLIHFPDMETMMKYRIIVTTLVTAGRLVTAKIPQSHFTHIFIDEAGHAVEPECTIAIAGLLDVTNDKGGQLVLAGDPEQLGPVLRSPVAVKNGLVASLLERFMQTCPVYQREGPDHPYNANMLTKLVRNYRSHPDILRLPNDLFYNGELQAFADEMLRNCMCQWELLPKKKFPIIFHGVEGIDQREGKSPSFFNIEEVEVVWDYVKELLEEQRGGIRLTQKDIGIISPYRRQVQKIAKVLKNKNKSEIKVGSVEEFQGQERLVIIISTVRSTNEENLRMDIDYKLGFLRNPKRFNVALTRAKALLIVIGNPYMLAKDAYWNGFLNYCLTSKCQDIFCGIDIAHFLTLGTAKTFGKNADEVFLQYTLCEMSSFNTTCVDLVSR
uniref:RNA helicase n=1 Tax=Saccoglossus kowalevskii TaxID=10224 RepID=A0ABM0LVZ1_SACKO|nr:PREDICTED: putative helicase MOV-10-like [Saccoglossus kowalevskii]